MRSKIQISPSPPTKRTPFGVLFRLAAKNKRKIWTSAPLARAWRAVNDRPYIMCFDEYHTLL